MQFIVPIIAAIILYFVFRKQEKQRREHLRKYPVYRFKQPLDSWNGKLGDIKFKCTRKDVGAVIFAVKPDIGSTAYGDTENYIAIRDDGKELGIIPRKKLTGYKEWCHGNVCTGIGVIHYDEPTNELWADISVLSASTSDEDAETAFSQYLAWVEEHFGSSYIQERYR